MGMWIELSNKLNPKYIHVRSIQLSMVRSMYDLAKVQGDINSMGPVTKDACLLSSTGGHSLWSEK